MTNEQVAQLDAAFASLGALQQQLEASLSGALWQSYLFVQSEALDWAAPLLTVSIALKDSGIWRAAQRAHCAKGIVSAVCYTLLEWAGV
jgi:hypothetical protein